MAVKYQQEFSLGDLNLRLMPLVKLVVLTACIEHCGNHLAIICVCVWVDRGDVLFMGNQNITDL